MHQARLLATATLILSMTLPTSAVADGDRLLFLKRENAEMKRMIQEMQSEMQALAAQARETSHGHTSKEDLVISTTNGGIKVESANGNTFQAKGLLEFDHDSYDDLWNSGQGSAEENEIRRSRIILAGSSGERWAYNFAANIVHETGKGHLETAFLKYKSAPVGVTVGRFKRPGMLEERGSPADTITIERSILNDTAAAVLNRPEFGGIAVGHASHHGIPMSWQIGIYDNEEEESDGGDVYGIGGRIAVMPGLREDSFFHIGASFYAVDFNGHTHRMQSRMGVHSISMDRAPFRTYAHETGDIEQLGLELAYVDGPFSLQGEIMDLESDGTNNMTCGTGTIANGMPSGFTDTCDMEMDGFYLQSAWTLTGETRGYRMGPAAFAAINPKNEGGAWELVARYENINVDVPGRGITADLERVVLGLNWYATPSVKFMANYMDADLSCTTGQRAYLDGNAPSSTMKTLKFDRCTDDQGNALSLRGQYAF